MTRAAVDFRAGVAPYAVGSGEGDRLERDANEWVLALLACRMTPILQPPTFAILERARAIAFLSATASSLTSALATTG